MDVRVYLLSKPETVEDFPFGPQAAVYKIAGKMFALTFERGGQPCVNLKCDPFEAQQLRDVFDTILPGYHMNKRHWITVILDGAVPDAELRRLIDYSYTLVIAQLPKAVRQGLQLRHGLDSLDA